LGIRNRIRDNIHFEKIKGLNDIEYSPHYHVPYSADLAKSVQSLGSSNFIDEDSRRYQDLSDPASLPRTKYSYSLSNDGQKVVANLTVSCTEEYSGVKEIVDACKKIAGLPMHRK